MVARENDGEALGGGAAGEGAPPSSDVAPLVSDVPPPGAASSVSDAELRAFLADAATQRRVRAIVEARVRGPAAAAVVDDVVQQANVAALTSRSRPRSMDTAPGWLSAVTVRAVARARRDDASRASWIDPEADVDAQIDAPAYAAGDEPGGGWLVSRWLAREVAPDPRDQETYELLAYKAATGKTLAEVAADHGMDEKALGSRVARFKQKYVPRYRRRVGNAALAALTGALTIALIAWLLARTGPQEAKRPRPAPSASTVPSAAPSAVAPEPAPVAPAPVAPAPKPAAPAQRYDEKVPLTPRKTPPRR